MKQLEKEFKKWRFDFVQFKREGDFAIYQKSLNGGTPSFEVVEIQSHNGMEVFGNWVEPAEYLPNNEQWGKKGWTYLTLENAEKRFKELCGK